MHSGLPLSPLTRSQPSMQSVRTLCNVANTIILPCYVEHPLLIILLLYLWTPIRFVQSIFNNSYPFIYEISDI